MWQKCKNFKSGIRNNFLYYPKTNFKNILTYKK